MLMDAARDLDDAMIKAGIVGRIGLDDVRAEFHGLAHERQDFGKATRASAFLRL